MLTNHKKKNHPLQQSMNPSYGYLEQHKNQGYGI